MSDQQSKDEQDKSGQQSIIGVVGRALGDSKFIDHSTKDIDNHHLNPNKPKAKVDPKGEVKTAIDRFKYL